MQVRANQHRHFECSCNALATGRIVGNDAWKDKCEGGRVKKRGQRALQMQPVATNKTKQQILIQEFIKDAVTIVTVNV
jgi:hypothetical protein